MPEKNWLEWSVFAASAVVLAFTFGFLGYEAFVSTVKPTAIEIELGTPEAHDDYYAVPVTIKNVGSQSIEDVQVDVTLMQEQEEVETASITMPTLPRESSREGHVAFSSDPGEADEIRTQIVSYVVP